MDQKPYDTTPMAYPTYDYGFTELQSTTTYFPNNIQFETYTTRDNNSYSMPIVTSTIIPIQEANASCSTPTTAYMASSTPAAPINNSVPRNIFNAANGSTLRRVYVSNSIPTTTPININVSPKIKIQRLIANGFKPRRVYISSGTSINNSIQPKSKLQFRRTFKPTQCPLALPKNTEKKRKRILDMLEDGTPIIYEVEL